MVGLSPGNGHPYSFAAIFNGYDEEGMAACPYPRILGYLRQRPPGDFGIADAQVTAVWTPDAADARKIARAARIPRVVDDLAELADLVDAVIVARDDPDSHWPIAEPFLKRGRPVFVDKPLTADVGELKTFEPFLRRGLLMSCSTMRYAAECEAARASIADLGDVRAVNAICGEDDWVKYGVHLVEACYAFLTPRTVSVRSVGTAGCHVVRARLAQEALAVFQVVRGLPSTFQFEVFGTRGKVALEVRDFFAMNRRALMAFVEMVRTGAPPIPAEETVEITSVLIAGERSFASNGREVILSEVR